MLRRAMLQAGLALAMSKTAFAAPSLREEALDALAARTDLRRDRLALVDFGLHSSAPRLRLVNLAAGTEEALLTTHGRGSDPDNTGFASVFSNVAGSYASSLGAYRTGARYHGAYGLSLRLDGLSPENSNARARALVVHAAAYAAPAHVAAYGKAGRSLGCFAVDPARIAEVVDWLEGGVLLYAARTR